jgi:hypothetical protein
VCAQNLDLSALEWSKNSFVLAAKHVPGVDSALWLCRSAGGGRGRGRTGWQWR